MGTDLNKFMVDNGIVRSLKCPQLEAGCCGKSHLCAIVERDSPTFVLNGIRWTKEFPLPAGWEEQKSKTGATVYYNEQKSKTKGSLSRDCVTEQEMPAHAHC